MSHKGTLLCLQNGHHAKSIAAVATTSSLWIAYDLGHLVMALGHEGSNEKEVTNSFESGLCSPLQLTPSKGLSMIISGLSNSQTTTTVFTKVCVGLVCMSS